MRFPVFLALARHACPLMAFSLGGPAAMGSAAFLVLSGATVQADASLHLEVTLDHLVKISDVALEGTPEEAHSLWEDVPGGGRRIVTYTRVHVLQKAYGEASPDVWIRTLGGQVGDIGQKVEGEAQLVPGERSVLFLKAFPEGSMRVVEMAQGQYLVKREEKEDRLLLSPYLGKVIPSRDQKERARAARVLLHGRPLGEAMAAIRQARKDAGRLIMGNFRSRTVLLVALLSAPVPAAAFCRTWSCDPAKGSCPQDKDNPACLGGDPAKNHKPLYWPQRCIGFSLHEKASAKLDSNPDRARAKFMRIANLSFATWQQADCGQGKRPSLSFYDLGFVSCDRQEFNGYNPDNAGRPTAQGNANLIVFRDKWPVEYASAGNTLALTTLTFNIQSGEIYDADIEINGEVMITTSDVTVTNDLQSILTHEIGHFLGIAHSPDPTATMFATYEPGSLSLRDLAPDDINAVCSIYGPERTGLPACDPTPRHGYAERCAVPAPPPEGCSAAGHAGGVAGGVAFAWIAGAMVVGARRRRH